MADDKTTTARAADTTTRPPAPTDEAKAAIPAAKAQARAQLVAAELAADTARELAELAGKPMAPLNRAREDALGRELPDDLDEARLQQREAIAIRDQRVAVDVARTQRGLAPKFATK